MPPSTRRSQFQRLGRRQSSGVPPIRFVVRQQLKGGTRRHRDLSNGATMNNWPTFNLVHLPIELDGPAPDDVRRVASELTRQGVPEGLFQFYRANEAIRHVVLNQKNLVRFGRIGFHVSMGVDVATGSIVAGTDEFVNSSIETFTATVKAVTARFPFYSVNEMAVEEVVDRVVKDVVELIQSVESRALERDGFWQGVIDDIQMGDAPTEWVVLGFPREVLRWRGES